MAFTTAMLAEFADAIRVTLSGVSGLDTVMLGEGSGTLAVNSTVKESRMDTDLTTRIVGSDKAPGWAWDVNTKTLSALVSFTDADFVDKYLAEVGFFQNGLVTLTGRYTIPGWLPRYYFQLNDTIELFLLITISVSEVVTWS